MKVLMAAASRYGATGEIARATGEIARAIGEVLATPTASGRFIHRERVMSEARTS